MMDSVSATLFADATVEKFTNKARLAQSIKSLCDTGICFFFIPGGKCFMRPDIKILQNCVIYIRHFSENGSVAYYRFEYEEEQYESFTFN